MASQPLADDAEQSVGPDDPPEDAAQPCVEGAEILARPTDRADDAAQPRVGDRPDGAARPCVEGAEQLVGPEDRLEDAAQLGVEGAGILACPADRADDAAQPCVEDNTAQLTTNEGESDHGENGSTSVEDVVEKLDGFIVKATEFMVAKRRAEPDFIFPQDQACLEGLRDLRKTAVGLPWDLVLVAIRGSPLRSFLAEAGVNLEEGIRR